MRIEDRGKRARSAGPIGLVAVALALALPGLGVSALASAHPHRGRRAKPAVTLTMPASAVAGAKVHISGKVRNAPAAATVTLERRQGRRWKPVARPKLSHGAFAATLTAPSEGEVLKIQAALRLGRRRLAVSRPRVLAVAKAAPAPARGSPAGGSAPGSEGPLLRLRSAPVELAVGSVVPLVAPAPLTSIETLDGQSGDGAGVELRPQGEGLAAIAAASAQPRQLTIVGRGSACTAEGCGQRYELEVPIVVRGLAAPPGNLDDLPVPSPDRVAQAVGGVLVDELIVTLGSAEEPGTREQAEAVAASAGGVVSGGLEGSGIYQVRWASPQDLQARATTLEEQPIVTSVGPASVGLYESASAYPVAPGYDQARWTWPYEQVHAAQAWQLTKGSDVEVGIIDEGTIYTRHEDLDVPEVFGLGVTAFHATHVAGLACAKGSPLVGMVGLAQGCPLVSAPVGYAGNSSDAILQAMKGMAARPAVKVVNVSMGFGRGCADQSAFDRIESVVNKEKGYFGRFLGGREGKRIVWTFAAGNNCAPFVASPWAANAQLPNVLAVAATNSDGSLASFSNYGAGIDVAAPGGVSVDPLTEGLMSTSSNGSYETSAGTSMAAPVVAGIAALVRSAHPGFSADQAGQCVSGSAGSGGTGTTVGRSVLPAGFNGHFPYAGTIPIVNARAAVECIARSTASSYSGSGDGDGWAVALSQDAVYNVFHHSGSLEVACHWQADASSCWPPRTITDADGNSFATSGHPGLYLDQGTGRLYVYATRAADASAGVVCIDTLAASEADAFCGYTNLTGANGAALPGISAVSNAALVGSRWFAFNYYDGEGVSGARNKLLCFDVATHAACSGQPFGVAQLPSFDEDDSYPPPAVTAIGGRVIVPLRSEGVDELACFDGNTESGCSGAHWPIELGESYDSFYGAAFPMLDSSNAIHGFCLPTGTDPCFNLAGTPVPTPPEMPAAIEASSGWNGPGLIHDSKVYVPNGNRDEVQCFDYATSEGCANFPRFFSDLALLYTVNADPERPNCLWVNSDSGSGQIQNFDPDTGGECR